MADISRCRYNNILWTIAALLVVDDLVPCQGTDRFNGPGNGKSQGVAVPESLVKLVMDEIIGGIVAHLDFLQDDLALALDFFCRKRGVQKNISQQVDGA